MNRYSLKLVWKELFHPYLQTQTNDKMEIEVHVG